LSSRFITTAARLYLLRVAGQVYIYEIGRAQCCHPPYFCASYSATILFYFFSRERIEEKSRVKIVRLCVCREMRQPLHSPLCAAVAVSLVPTVSKTSAIHYLHADNGNRLLLYARQREEEKPLRRRPALQHFRL